MYAEINICIASSVHKLSFWRFIGFPRFAIESLTFNIVKGKGNEHQCIISCCNKEIYPHFYWITSPEIIDLWEKPLREAKEREKKTILSPLLAPNWLPLLKCLWTWHLGWTFQVFLTKVCATGVKTRQSKIFCILGGVPFQIMTPCTQLLSQPNKYFYREKIKIKYYQLKYHLFGTKRKDARKTQVKVSVNLMGLWPCPELGKEQVFSRDEGRTREVHVMWGKSISEACLSRV